MRRDADSGARALAHGHMSDTRTLSLLAPPPPPLPDAHGPSRPLANLPYSEAP